MDQNKFLLPVAVIVAGLFIAGAVIWNGSRPAGTGNAGGGAPAADIAKVNTEGNPFIGQADAPVTIAFWTDYQCPFCKQFELNTLPQIVQEYVSTGKAKVVFLDFAFLGPDSIEGALYSRAVWKLYPERYYAWREAMYRAQDEEHGGFGNAASIDRLNATVAGLDAARIAADVKANRASYQALLDRDRAEAGEQGVSATPSIIIGKQLVAGAYPYPTFKAAIDTALES